MQNGVIHVPLSRMDLGDARGPRDAQLSGAFGLEGDLFIQPLPGGRALLNADLPLRESETNPFIGALLKNGLVVQAYHQHFPTSPQIWFVHFRGSGTPAELARKARAAIGVTGIHLPQAEGSKSTTLDAHRLAALLHGHASVGDDGVVTVWIYRTDHIRIAGIEVNPQTNISTNVEFKPLGGSDAEVIADYSMTSREVDPVINRMLNELDWDQGCLYNQETDEQPQLYFDHMVKRGDAYALAQELRTGLDLTAAR